MVVLYVFIDHMSQMPLTKDEHLVQAFMFYAPDKPLCEWV